MWLYTVLNTVAMYDNAKLHRGTEENMDTLICIGV